MNPARIRFIIPYFGKWPFWMPFFLESCRFNPDIDWLFFTDCGVPPDAPSNVRFIPLSFGQYCENVSQRLGIAFAPTLPYKLCDLKPALGFVHSEELDGYDFWGFSDIDLVYGNLRAYFHPARLERFDLLSTHARRISGHLCLIRNTPEMRACFKRVPDWAVRLTDNTSVGFDEGAFSRLFIRYKNLPDFIRRTLSRSNPLWRRSEFVEACTTPNGKVPWHDGSFRFPEFWRWDHGVLTNSADGDREFPYFHFICWKGREDWKAEAESQSLTPNLPKQHRWKITTRGFLRLIP